MLRIYFKAMLGILIYCIFVFPVSGEEQNPTPAPSQPAGATTQKDATIPSTANGNRTTNGQTFDSQADIIRADGERRIARTPSYPEAALQSPAEAIPPLPGPADSRAVELKNQADALAAQGNLRQAIALYNQALVLAPRSAELFRGRALALQRLGDRVQAQLDYRRFLDLDPQAQNRVREEMRLFDQSTGGLTTPVNGTVVRESVGYMPPSTLPAPVSTSEIFAPPPDSSSYPLPSIQNWRPLPVDTRLGAYSDFLSITANRLYEVARNAFSDGNYDTAYQRTQEAAVYMPQARARALAAQSLFALGSYHGAAAEARTAVTMGPLIDSTTLYSYYGFNVARYRKQFQALQDYVRVNPSSAEARFLLGYQHRILNQKEPAHAQLAVAAVLDPLDAVAKEMLARDGVEIVGAEERAAKKMMEREGVSGSVRVTRVPPPPAPAAAPTDETIKR